MIRRAAPSVAIAVGLFAALTVARTADVSTTFWLLGEQIRDWSLALGGWGDLPLSGTPSTVGGRSLGPVYYWTLWLTRATIGPFVDNLPHAGAIGLSMIQSGADVALFFALRRHTGSAPLALAMVLLVATSPYDMALSATIWNPPLAVALVKVALALFLVSAAHPSRWRMAATVAAAWLAVQAHSPAIFVFVPLAAWFVVRDAAARQWVRAAQTVRLLIEIILILQVPYLIDRLTSPAQGAPTVALEALARVATSPASAAPVAAYENIRDAIRFIWIHPIPFYAITIPLLIAAAAAVWAVRRRPWMLFVTLGPMAVAIVAFSGWTRPFDHYWFLTLSPPLALMLAEAVSAAPAGRIRESITVAALGAVLLLQPGRLDAAAAIHKLPAYGTLLQGTKEIRRRTPEVRDIFTEFELPSSTDATFPYVCMGGRVTPSAGYHAFIAKDGSVSFRTTQ